MVRADDILSGNRRALARAITLAESSRRDHRLTAENLLQDLLPATGNALRLGVSGVPGVGKSTFIETFGLYLIEQGLKVAVLAVDPTSPVTGGSILGDKTRMEQLSRRSEAFIRPSPTGGTLGGVARRTRESLLLCEAAGFDVIIIETVGVGQSETAVKDLVDMFLLLLLPGGGDELQGIKKGIIEIADLICINKADGDLADEAKRAAAEYRGALRLLRPPVAEWRPPVVICSALEGGGIAEIWSQIKRFREIMAACGQLDARRARQARGWLWNELTEALVDAFRAQNGMEQLLEACEKDVMAGKKAPSVAARLLLERFLGKEAAE
ncbi:MAG: methylmalonyl Co-A mutase-associated GTPase MeaB [Kiloniellales bacterium]|nr:methylmalonyl Co-A mutase-associated GTPase MeaB [Kiloniellales bacterium]